MLTCCDFVTWNRRVVKRWVKLSMCVLKAWGMWGIHVATLLYILEGDRKEWPT